MPIIRRIIFFIIFTIVAVAIIIKFIFNIYEIYKENYSLNPIVNTVRILLIVLVAGAIGNLIDRIVNGYVIDFISFDFINFPIFNVADCYITVSCILLLIICIFKVDSDTFNNVFTFKRNPKDK